MNIQEFLLERINEDEAVASEATGAQWVALPGVNASMVNIDPTLIRDEKWKYDTLGHIATTSNDAAYADHIARHDPARVLAECAAKRALVEQVSDVAWGGYAVRDVVLETLAAAYSGHPDYQEEWRP